MNMLCVEFVTEVMFCLRLKYEVLKRVVYAYMSPRHTQFDNMSLFDRSLMRRSSTFHLPDCCPRSEPVEHPMRI